MNVSYIELYMCLRGFETPRLKEDLIRLAKRNGASSMLLSALNYLPEGIYVNLADVIQEIKVQQKNEVYLFVS